MIFFDQSTYFNLVFQLLIEWKSIVLHHVRDGHVKIFFASKLSLVCQESVLKS